MAWCNLQFSGHTGVLEAVAAVLEVSASGNYRTIQLYVGVKAIDYSGGRQGQYHVSCKEAGIDYKSGCTISGTETSIFNEQFQVYVPAGGTTADITFSFSAGLSSSSAGWREITGSITQVGGLSIVSDTSISSAANIQFGQNCNITWSALAGMYYKLELSAGSGSDKFYKSSGILLSHTNGAYNYTGITIPESVSKNFPRSASGTISITLSQYSDSAGSNRVGSPAYGSFTATLNQNIRPRMENATISIDNSGNSVVASWGIALAGYSKINATASASGVYNSTIDAFIISGEYIAEVPGSSLSYTGETIRTTGNKKLLIKCRDSRGRESDPIETNVISFTQHSSPIVESFVMSKSTSGKFVATARWSYDEVGGKNGVTSEIFYKRTSSLDWTKYGTISNNVATELTDIVPDELASYNFRIRITDKLGFVAQKEAFISTIQVLLDYRAGGKGLGIGKICESDSMEVAMDAKFFNDVFLKGKRLEEYISNDVITNELLGNRIYPVGSIYMSTNSISPASMFGGRWERIKNAFLFGANDSGTYGPGSRGGEEAHTLSTNEMPSHAHAPEKTAGPGAGGFAVVVGDTSLGADQATANSSAAYSWVNVQHYTGKAGGGVAHNNMPPYLSVYMWKRIG